MSAAAPRDARGRTLELPRPPRRIVSLVPSQTELLADLGLDERVVGITRFCVRPPEWSRTKRNVGGTKQVRHERVEALRPDLVLANLEENTRADVERLERLAPVWVTDVKSVEGALAMIGDVGRLTARKAEAAALAAQIAAGFEALAGLPPIRVAYLIWQDPLMTVGGDTFIHDVLRRGGLVNVFAERSRYPELTPAELLEAAPERVLLSSEPYPFRERHKPALARLLPGLKLQRVDGEPCSWYGSRLLATPAYLGRLRGGEEPPEPA